MASDQLIKIHIEDATLKCKSAAATHHAEESNKRKENKGSRLGVCCWIMTCMPLVIISLLIR